MYPLKTDRKMVMRRAAPRRYSGSSPHLMAIIQASAGASSNMPASRGEMRSGSRKKASAAATRNTAAATKAVLGVPSGSRTADMMIPVAIIAEDGIKA